MPPPWQRPRKAIASISSTLERFGNMAGDPVDALLRAREKLIE